MFPLNSRKNLLYFFSADMQYRQFPSCELNHLNHTITMTTPLGTDYFLQIKNKIFFDKISHFIELNKSIKIIQPEESIMLIERLKILLLTKEKLDCHAIVDFYHESSEKLQNIFYDNIKHLL